MTGPLVVPEPRGRGVSTALRAGLEDAGRQRGWSTLLTATSETPHLW